MSKKTTDKVQIVPLSVEDAAAMVEVIYRTWLATYPGIDGITIHDVEKNFATRDEDAEGWRKWVAGSWEDLAVFVAKVNERVVGVCLVMKMAEENCVDGMYVLPEYQRRGIGTTLWETAKSFLDPCKETVVEVSPASSVSFYQALGFKETGNPSPPYRMRNDGTLTQIAMRRAAESAS